MLKTIWEPYSNKSNERSNIILEVDGELMHDPEKVAGYINHFYTNVASFLVNKLPTRSGLYDIFSTRFLQIYQDKGVIADSFHLQPVTNTFIQKELANLCTSKSTGLDNIPARFLKDGSLHLADPITFLVNLSISNGTVPVDLKTARVHPLHLKKSRLEIGNYRPVPILSIVSKILDRAVYTQLESYLNDNNILYDLQSGFHKGFSTDTCLIHLSDYIRNQTAQHRHGSNRYPKSF